MKYKVIKSWRKTLSLTVKYGEVIIKAPYLTPKLSIENFLHNNKAWIDKRLAAQGNTKKLSVSEIAELKGKARAYIPSRVVEIAEKF